jgi:hypothetical protein
MSLLDPINPFHAGEVRLKHVAEHALAKLDETAKQRLMEADTMLKQHREAAEAQIRGVIATSISELRAMLDLQQKELTAQITRISRRLAFGSVIFLLGIAGVAAALIWLNAHALKAG